MPPSVIIDTDLDPYDNTILYAIEQEATWKATALGGGNAVWAQVYDVADFDPALGSGLVLDRIRCAQNTEGLVYAIGHALKTDGVTYAEFCGRSSNAGLTWNWVEIGEIVDPGEGFTLGEIQDIDPAHNNDLILASYTGGGGEVNINIQFDPVGSFPYTNSHVELILPEALPLGVGSLTLEYDAIGEWPSLNYDTSGNAPPVFDHRLGSPYIVTGSFTPVTGGYHFSGHVNPNEMVDPSVMHLGWFYGYNGRWQGNTGADLHGQVLNLVIDGVEYTSGVSRAFDVAPMNGNWLYYGATDKIWRSIDGGNTWEAMIDDLGAYDVCVDPQAAGVIYIWSSVGGLNLIVDGNINAALDTETAKNAPLRLARDPGSGKLWALKNGADLRMRNLGSWTDQGSGYSGATGLHAYAGNKLIFVDAGEIYISDDGGVAVTAKKGTWSEFATGVNAHRMTASE
jgi:hypothetical protein